MKLSSHALNEAFAKGLWKAYRGDERIAAPDIKVGPNSVDVTLHAKLLFPWPGDLTLPPPDFFPTGAYRNAGYTVDPRVPSSLQWASHTMGTEGVLLRPRDFVLGAARERFDCDEPLTLDAPFEDYVNVRQRRAWFVQMYEGRSSCGRLGLASHITAGFGDYGFKGAFTLELYNHSPFDIRIFPGMRIGQVAFEEISPPSAGYQGAYSGINHNDGPVAPVLGPTRF